MYRQSGFTLPELLVVGGVLALLLVGALFFLQPRHNPAVLRDAQRRIDIAMLAQAVNEYHADHGKLPPSIVAKEQFIGSGENESDICPELVPAYLPDLPFDPVAGSADSMESCATGQVDYITVYAVQRLDDLTVTFTAPLTESGNEIKITRSYKD